MNASFNQVNNSLSVTLHRSRATRLRKPLRESARSYPLDTAHTRVLVSGLRNPVLQGAHEFIRPQQEVTYMRFVGERPGD